MAADSPADAAEAAALAVNDAIRSVKKADWRHLRFELHIEPPTWVLADMVLAHGDTRILFPSQAHEGGTNVVVYSDRLKDGNSVTVNDSDGRLPRDMSSWS